MRTICNSLLLLVLLGVGKAPAQDATQQVAEVTNESLATRQDTQSELDGWAAERGKLKQRWDVALAQVAYLEERATLERGRLRALEAAGDELARRLDESRRLEESLEDTLLVIIGRLDEAVAQDLPFLQIEREERLRSVRRDLGNPGATPADKLRRVLEALLIETGYGGALELNQERITVGDEELTCELLHVGRLGLFWLTPDETRGGIWNASSGIFEELTGGELDSIRRAVHMATRRSAVGVQKLPLGRVGS